MMPGSIFHNFVKHARVSPKKDAIICDQETFSYEDLYLSVTGLCKLLIDKSIKPHDKIGVLLPNSIEFAALILAASQLQITLIPQCTSLPAHKTLSIFNDIGIDMIVCWHGLYEDINKDAEKTMQIVKVSENDINTWRKYDATDAVFYKNNKVEEKFIITLTSGSTGDPKPIVLSQATKIKRIESAISIYSLSKDDIILVATPMYHSLAQRLTLIPLFVGGTAVILPRYNIDLWLKAVEKHKVTFTIAVASQLKQLLSKEKLGTSLTSLKSLVSSSELLSDEYKTQLSEILKCDFHECYGASEVGIVTNLSFSDSKIIKGSVGKAIPGVDLKIFLLGGREAKIGEVGEIYCRSNMSFSGYHDNKNLTESSYSYGYFKTGDLGKLDEHGFLYFSGRKKEIIISGGINIYPKDIEDVLLEIREVQECCVVAADDRSLGEIPIAAIVLKAGAEQNIKLLQRKCIKELASYQQPRKFIFVDSLAKNSVGKVQKKLVKNQIINRI